MKITTSGLVIREQTLSENDRLVTILTEKEGVIRAFARSAKNMKNKMFSGTQLLCYSDFNIYKGKDKYIINEADLNKVFFNLRDDIVKISLAQYFCEIAMVLQPKHEESKDFLQLILNALYCISMGKYSRGIIKSAVELRASAIVGFMPNLVCCSGCHEYNATKMYFFIDEGKILCESCCATALRNEAVCVSPSVLAALRHILYAESKKVFSFSVSEKSLSQICFITQKYLERHSGSKFKTLEVYKELTSFN